MKTRLLVACFTLLVVQVSAQEMKTLFGQGNVTGGYGAITNKFTTIGGEFANLSGVYGGVFIDRRWMLGLAFAGSTNFLAVPPEYSLYPLKNMTYQYSQGGLLVERILGSNKSFHVVFNLFAGAGHTMQYHRDEDEWDDWENYDDGVYDQNWFYVIEPGVQLEMNLFRWMRLSPGVSYRQTYQSKGLGLTDSDLSDWTYSLTLKFGGFGKKKNKEDLPTY